MSASPRIFLIGLDGGTFRILESGFALGRLPTLKRLIETGVSGILTSTIPPATIPAFPTLMTGKNPGKHGVFDFLERVGNHLEVPNATKISGKTIWRILSDHGKKCIVVNVPLTFPPEQINGVIVSGMLTPIGKDFTHPKMLMSKLNELTGGYPVRFDPNTDPSDLVNWTKALHTMIEKRRKAIFFLLENWDWDLFAFLFRATDIVQHQLWWNREEVLRIYEHIDEILNELLTRYENAYMFIFSDHGFRPYNKYFHVNMFLNSLGFIKTKKQREIGLLSPFHALGVKDAHGGKVRYQLATMGITRLRLRKLLPSRLHKVVLRFAGPLLRKTIPATNLGVDETRSKAYFAPCPETLNLIINASSKTEYDEILISIKHAFETLYDPETGNKVVKQVFHKDSIYNGPFVNRAPDIVILLEEGYYPTTKVSAPKIFEIVPQIKGTHEIDGIFIAKGPHLKTGEKVQKISLQDLAPTLLHLMEVPIPDDVDGEVKQEIYNPGSPPSVRKPQFYTEKPEARKIQRLTEEEEEEIKDRLRGLGYLD